MKVIDLKLECVDSVAVWGKGPTILLGTRCDYCETPAEVELTYEDVLKLKKYFEEEAE